MRYQDFNFMQRGRVLKSLAKNETHLLEDINIRGPNKRRAILLLHGFSSSPAVFRVIIPQLQFYDAIIAPALPGHSQNIETFAKVKAQEWVDTTEKIIKELTKQYQEVDVMGLSLGGILATHIAQIYPIHHLYLLAPAFKLKSYLNYSFTMALIQLLKIFGIKKIKNRGGDIFASEHNELVYSHLPLSTINEILTLINASSCKKINCPTDIFLGEKDRVVDSKFIAQMFRNFPNCKLHWLKNSAHVLPLDNAAQEIVECVKDNFKR